MNSKKYAESYHKNQSNGKCGHLSKHLRKILRLRGARVPGEQPSASRNGVPQANLFIECLRDAWRDKAKIIDGFSCRAKPLLWIISSKLSTYSKKVSLKKVSSKKAQFYIFTAVILLAVVFSLYAVVPGTAKKDANTFAGLKKNFEKESEIVVNAAVYSKENVSASWDQFNSDFYNYARAKDPDFGMVSMLSYYNNAESSGSWTRIHNLLGRNVLVQVNSGSAVLLGHNEFMASARAASISIGVNLSNSEEAYVFDIPQSASVQALLVSSKAKSTKIAIIN